MKKTGLLLMMLTASLSTLLFSCSTDKTEDGQDEVKEVTLSVTGNNGQLITVPNLDVTQTVTVKATETVDRDIEVTLVTDATDGSAVLESSTTVIAKGTDKAEVKIVFPASKYPEGTAERPIKVTASTTDPKVIFSPAETTFNVMGLGGDMLSVLTANAPALTINTGDDEGVAIINFSLTKPLEKDLNVFVEYGPSSNFVVSDYTRWSINPVIIPKGQTSLQLKITVAKGGKGEMPLMISCEDNSGVRVSTEGFTFQFVSQPSPDPVASISTTHTGILDVGDQDAVKTIDVKLTKAGKEKIVVKLAAASNNSLNAVLASETVTFEVGETSKSVNITFPAAVFVKNTLAKITVTATSEDVEVKSAASSVLFNVAGPNDRQDGQVEWYVMYDFEDEAPALVGDLKFPKAYEKQGFIRMTVYSEIRNSAIKVFDPAVTFELVLTGNLTTDDIVFEDGTELIYSDTDYGYCNFLVKKSAIGKEGTMDFISNGTTFISTQKPIKIKVVSVQ